MLATRIKGLRMKRNLTQEAAALALGMNPAYFRKLEQGKANPTLKTLYDLSELFQVSAAELLSAAE